jgi:ankyrin repeat protein
MKAHDFSLPRGLLSTAQKQSVLADLLLVVQQNPEVTLNMIISDTLKENGADYPEKLGELISRLGAPFSCLQANARELDSHKSNVQNFFQTHSPEVLGLLVKVCKHSEGWSSKKIREIAKQFQIPIPEIIQVRFAISKGKIYWELRDGLKIRRKYELPDTEHIEMSWEDFKTFKDSGKRNPSNPNKNNNIDIFFAELSGKKPIPRTDRNPTKRKNLSHIDPRICHVCAYDVDTYSAQGLHMKSKESHSLKRNPCPDCGEDFDFNRDHIPANSLLKKLNERFTEQGIKKSITQGEGIVIAVPTYLHCFVSASYKHKAKTRDELEAIHPSAAIYKDINSYLRFFWESPTEELDVKIIGAFRYLYRRNTKIYEGFSSPHTDHLIMRSIKRCLKRKDTGKKVFLLPPPSRWRHQSFFANNHQSPSFAKLDDGTKNDITLAIMLRDIQELEKFYREPNYISFIIKILARDNKLYNSDNFHELMHIGSHSGSQPLIFEILKRALEDDEITCQKILSGIVEQTEITLDEHFSSPINGLTIFDIYIIYYSSIDLNDFLETIFSFESFEEFWISQDITGITPTMRAIRSDNSEALKFTMRNRVKNIEVFDKDTTDVTFYEVLNCFYRNHTAPLEGINTLDHSGHSALWHAARENSEDCLKVILVAHPELDNVKPSDSTSPTISKLISSAMQIAEIIASKGGEEDEDLIEMLIVHDEGDLAREILAFEGTLSSIGEENLTVIISKILPFFITNSSTDDLFKILGFIDENAIIKFRQNHQDTLIHYAVRENKPDKIALCAAILRFEPEDKFSFNTFTENFQDILNEFHDEGILVSTENPLDPASVVNYRMQYKGALQDFLSKTNQQNQTALALACESENLECIKVLLACGAKLEKCVYSNNNTELRMMALTIDLIDAENPDIIYLINRIEVEPPEATLFFLETLLSIHQDFLYNHTNPLHYIFDISHFASLDNSIDSDDDETDEERLDFAESIQNLLNKLSDEQKVTCLRCIQKIAPLNELLIELINSSTRRQENCAALLQLLQNQPQNAACFL